MAYIWAAVLGFGAVLAIVLGLPKASGSLAAPMRGRTFDLLYPLVPMALAAGAVCMLVLS